MARTSDPRRLRRSSKGRGSENKAPKSGGGASDPKAAQMLHGELVPCSVYKASLNPMLGDQADGANLYAATVIGRMNPRDAAEEMLIAQLLFAHSRVMHLTQLANQQTRLEAIRVLHEYADRASNTYRRLMLALAEYRRPPRTGDTFAVVKQANIAGQQVIQNHEKPSRNTTNEQGCEPRSEYQQAAAPGLPAHADGFGVAAAFHPAGAAVGKCERPANTGGQGSIADERNEAR